MGPGKQGEKGLSNSMTPPHRIPDPGCNICISLAYTGVKHLMLFLARCAPPNSTTPLFSLFAVLTNLLTPIPGQSTDNQPTMHFHLLRNLLRGVAHPQHWDPCADVARNLSQASMLAMEYLVPSVASSSVSSLPISQSVTYPPRCLYTSRRAFDIQLMRILFRTA